MHIGNVCKSNSCMDVTSACHSESYNGSEDADKVIAGLSSNSISNGNWTRSD